VRGFLGVIIPGFHPGLSPDAPLGRKRTGKDGEIGDCGLLILDF
jgi:hypothetical protein